MPVRQISTRPITLIRRTNRSTSLGGAGELEHEGVQRRVEGLGTEGGGQTQGLAPMLALPRDLHETDLALQRVALEGQVDHPARALAGRAAP